MTKYPLPQVIPMSGDNKAIGDAIAKSVSNGRVVSKPVVIRNDEQVKLDVEGIPDNELPSMSGPGIYALVYYQLL